MDFPEGSSVAGVKVMLVVSVRLSDTKRSSTVHNVTGASNVARWERSSLSYLPLIFFSLFLSGFNCNVCLPSSLADSLVLLLIDHLDVRRRRRVFIELLLGNTQLFVTRNSVSLFFSTSGNQLKPAAQVKVALAICIPRRVRWVCSFSSIYHPVCTLLTVQQCWNIISFDGKEKEKEPLSTETTTNFCRSNSRHLHCSLHSLHCIIWQ